jgi:hypothetical protein
MSIQSIANEIQDKIKYLTERQQAIISNALSDQSKELKTKSKNKLFQYVIALVNQLREMKQDENQDYGLSKLELKEEDEDDDDGDDGDDEEDEPADEDDDEKEEEDESEDENGEEDDDNDDED